MRETRTNSAMLRLVGRRCEHLALQGERSRCRGFAACCRFAYVVGASAAPGTACPAPPIGACEGDEILVLRHQPCWNARSHHRPQPPRRLADLTSLSTTTRASPTPSCCRQKAPTAAPSSA